MCGVVKCLVMLLMLRWVEACDAVLGGVGGPSVRAREGLGD